MRTWLFLAALALCSALTPSAHAQVRKGDVRLYLDLGLVSWLSGRTKGEAPNGDERHKTDNQLNAGPASGGVGGVGIGYAVRDWLIPSLYFSLQHTKNTHRDEFHGVEASNTDAARQFELRPFLEVPFNPDARFVLHGIAGLSFMRNVWNQGDKHAFGAGPALGVGGHGFITQRASLDLGLVFRGSFWKNNDERDNWENAGFRHVKQRQMAILFTLGASFWL